MTPGMRRIGTAVRLSILPGILLVAALLGNSVASGQSVKQPDMTPALNLGKMNFTMMCASCHGATALGTDQGPPLLHKFYHPGHHGDGAFYLAAKNGVRAHHWKFGDMPPVEGISDAQIASIVEYVRALQRANGLF